MAPLHPRQNDSTDLLTSTQQADIFTRANLLRDESRIEISFWNDRKQELQFLWMGCVAGSALALAVSSPFVFVGVPIVLGIVNTRLAQSRRAGLERSLNEIDRRHKAFLEFIDQHECLKFLEFSRVLRVQRGDGTTELVDPVHDDKKNEFRSIFDLINQTKWISIALGALGTLKLLAVNLHTKSILEVLIR